MSQSIDIKAFGTHGVLIEWENTVSEDILERILRFQSFLKERELFSSNFEMVPSYNSLLIINNKERVNFDALSKEIHNWYAQATEKQNVDRFICHLPVCYDEEFALDLDSVTTHLGISSEEIIRLHTMATYTVFGIGFLPGFMYLGGVDKRLQLPRKATPSPKVVKGAVAIAGQQTGVYPQESPGGWNIIGNCPIPIFDITRKEPCLVNVGDKIKFYQVSKAAYDLHKIEAEVGIFKFQKEKINA